jgi:hypothetical protein
MIKKIAKFILIFALIAGWIFSGWPQIWQNPRIPSKIQKARAATGLQYVGGAEGAGTSAAFNVSLTALTGGAASAAAAGDLVIVSDGFVSIADGNPGVGTAGYTEIADLYKSDSNDANLSVNWKIMGGTPDTTVSCNGSGVSTNVSVCAVQVWRNVNQTTPLDVTSTTATAANTGVPNGPAITPVTSGAQVVTVGGGTSDSAITDVTAPTGYGNLVSANPASDPGLTFRIGVASKAWSGSGAEDPAAWGGFDTSNVNSWAAVTLAIRPATTFLGNDTDPGINPTIAPGAATTTVGTFNLRTDSGVNDTVTNATATLSAGSSGGLFGVEITNSDNTTIYCSSYNPASDTVSLTGCNLPVTTASTTFNIRIKPKSHSAMAAPPGSTYSVTATITSITATNNNTSGTDTTSDIVTIDNASPNGATSRSGSAGNAQVTLNWTASNSSDFDTTNGSVILRWASGSAGNEVPQEGKSDYTAGNTITTATVACVISSAASASLSKIDGSGGSAGCTTDALTNGQQYTYMAFQRDTNGNYDAGASIGTFTPVSTSLTLTIDTSSVFIGTNTPGTPVATSSVLTVNTNSSTGYNIIINRASTTPTLFLNSDTIPDTPNGNNWTAPTATSTAGPSAIWTSGTTKGLGFRVKQTGTVSNTYSLIWWGTDDTAANALYSGISTSTAAQMIAKTTLGSGADENTVVEYKLDTATSQKSGSYISSPITFTATIN